MKNKQTQEVTLEIPQIDKANLRHAVDYYRKIAYHRGLVLEGVRLCAMRNRGYWYGIHTELVQEKGRPVKAEEVQDRIRTIQKLESEETYRRVLDEYNNQRIAAGLNEDKDGGRFGVVDRLKTSMEERLIETISWFSWEIYMCLLYVEIEAYRAHMGKVPELKNEVIDSFLQENQGTLEALKGYRDKVLHPQAKISEEQAIDRFFCLVGNSVGKEMELVFTIQRMIDCHIQCVGLGIIRSIDAELVRLIEICKSGKKPRIRGQNKFEEWIRTIEYKAPNVNLMAPQQFVGNTKKGGMPCLSMTSVIALVSRMMEHGISETEPAFQIPELPGDTDYVRMLMRAFILTSEGMGLVDTAKLLRSEDPRTLPLSETWKSVKEGAEPETQQEVQNLVAMERVALAIVHEPLRTYNKMIREQGVRVPNWMAQSVPNGKACRQLRDFRNIVFHVKVKNRSPDKIESEWLQNLERYPTIDMIHALLMFYASGKGFEKLRTRPKDQGGA